MNSGCLSEGEVISGKGFQITTILSLVDWEKEPSNKNRNSWGEPEHLSLIHI